MTTDPRTQPPGAPAPLGLSTPATGFLTFWLAEDDPDTARALKSGQAQLSAAQIDTLLTELKEASNVAHQERAVNELRIRRAQVRELDEIRTEIAAIRALGCRQYERQAQEEFHAGAAEQDGFDRLCWALALDEDYDQGALERYPDWDDVRHRARELALPL